MEAGVGTMKLQVKKVTGFNDSASYSNYNRLHNREINYFFVETDGGSEWAYKSRCHLSQKDSFFLEIWTPDPEVQIIAEWLLSN